MKNIKKILKGYLIAAGVGLHVFVLWMAAGWPILIDRLLVRTEPPLLKADYIVCLSGGMVRSNLPTDDGWQRVYSAVQLYTDGYGRKVLFSCGGAGGVTEAEVYAETARWLGCPEEAVAFEPGAGSTADHPDKLLRTEGLGISRDTRLNIVTSPLHTRRVGLCFKKAGFTRFRVVGGYVSLKKDPAVVRELRTSRFAEHRPSGKMHKDVFMRLRWRSSYFFSAMREAAAIAWYKIKGYI